MDSNTPFVPPDLFPGDFPRTGTDHSVVDVQDTNMWHTPGFSDIGASMRHLNEALSDYLEPTGLHVVPHRDDDNQDSAMQAASQIRVENAPTSADLADEVRGMYRVLDLISESGTNGYGKIYWCH